MENIIDESNEFIDGKRVNTRVVELVFTQNDDKLQLQHYENKLNQLDKQIEHYQNKKTKEKDIDLEEIDNKIKNSKSEKQNLISKIEEYKDLIGKYKIK